MISRERSRSHEHEITIRLRAVRELFEPLPVETMTSSPLRLRSGLDELMNELGARRLRDVTGAAIELPASELTCGVEEWVRWMIISYCELLLRETGNDLRAFRHDAYRALAIGMVLFVAGLTVSTIVTNSSDS